jgi:hypothetical protein
MQSLSVMGVKQSAGKNMITAVIVGWVLFNIAVAGRLILVRVVLPDREKLRRERERQSVVLAR